MDRCLDDLMFEVMLVLDGSARLPLLPIFFVFSPPAQCSHFDVCFGSH